MQPQPPRRTTHAVGGPKTMLVYDRWGSYGRPILLLHGLLFDRTMWWPAAAALGADSACTVIAPDLPGHGQTPARADHSLRRIACDLAVLLNGLHLHRAPIVVAHATAAPLAATFAASYATHAVRLLDLGDSALSGVDEVIAAAGLAEVPEIYRPYAEPRPDPELLRSYAGWREQPAMARAGSARPPAAFPHLSDPEEFAAEVRTLI